MERTPRYIVKILRERYRIVNLECFSKICGLLGIELSFPKGYVEVLNASIWKYDLTWKEGLCRHKQVTVKLLGWVLIQYEWGSLRREKPYVNTETHRGNGMCWQRQGSSQNLLSEISSLCSCEGPHH